MSNPIQVDFGQVEAASQQITSTATQIDQLLDDLNRQIQDLDTLWAGSASGDYQNVKKQWVTSAQDLQQVLASIGAAVNSAHEAYLQTEAQNASSWQQ
jgi:6 kDa early secretory antigenic target